jgi:hypothetical protein
VTYLGECVLVHGCRLVVVDHLAPAQVARELQGTTARHKQE